MNILNNIIVKFKNNKSRYIKIALCILVAVCFITVIAVCSVSEKDYDKKIYNESSTESTTYYLDESTTSNTEVSTEISTVVSCYFNKDGKLYGKKGQYSGLWKNLETIVNGSTGGWTALKQWVGDNTELKKSNYEEDKFVKINGYGTVHWSQGGHNWYSPYSIADKTARSNSELFFSQILKSDKEPDLDKAISEQSKKNDMIIAAADAKKDNILTDTAIKTENETAVIANAIETTTDAFQTTEKTTNTSTPNTKKTTGNVWGSDSCGTCSLAMVLSTLSGVTVSPPEVALAANALIGEKAWYKTILYSQSQAKLAEMAGFPVKTEPYNKATKAAMDHCLNNNGMAIFVTDKPAWASGNGRHYIAVRNKVGDKYYTCDSGKNPTGGFTYEEISAGYNQQYIVYIYPRGCKI